MLAHLFGYRGAGQIPRRSSFATLLKNDAVGSFQRGNKRLD